jgi:hypothetical protein
LIVKEIILGLYRGQFVPGQNLVEADLTARFAALADEEQGTRSPLNGKN